MGLFGKYVDPIETWMREVIDAVPEGYGRPGESYDVRGMLEEGLKIYVGMEQDPYWGAESLAKYLNYEQVPVPEKIIKKMLDVSSPSPESQEKIKQLLKDNNPDMTIEEYVAGLIPVEDSPKR